MKLFEMGQISVGVVGMLLTFYLSLTNNTWVTALFWSIFGFILFFLAGFGIRYFLRQVLTVASPAAVQGTESGLGSGLDIRVGADAGMEFGVGAGNEGGTGARVGTQLRVGAGESFQSVPLASLHQTTSTERVTETIRNWTNEGREG